jgi:phospholipid/cholesterol/gamma-HCH transport system substrate-binding protein
MKSDSRKRQVRVGLFLAIGMFVTGLAIFAVGSQSGLFQSKTTLYVYFGDVSGLVVGAPVRLGGLDIGVVSAVEFSKEIERAKARITLSVKSRYTRRIRRDSFAMIDSKGLLGDKIINITLGTAKSPQVHDGETLQTKPSPSIEQLTDKVDEAITAVTKVTTTANSALEVLATDQVREDIARITHATAGILEQADRGPGLVHSALYDPEYARDVKAILGSASDTLARLRSAVGRVDTALAAVESGGGLAHEVIYGDTGHETIAELGEAASALSAITREVRDGDGLAHGLIFDRDSGQSLRELNHATARLNHIMGEIEKGRGTLGGLLVDPSIYEDVKTILGNVQRNVLLKALIRYTIKEGDIERPATVKVERAAKQAPASQPQPPAVPAPAPVLHSGDSTAARQPDND